MDKYPDHSQRDHAIYAPSSMERTLNCHGSIAAIAQLLAEGYEEKYTPAAEEGTECHEAASAVLEGGSWDKATAFLSDEQEWIVEEYTNYAFDLIDRMIATHGKENVKVWIETRVRSPHKGYENNHGTADLCILVIPLRTLAVIDLKAGYTPVEVGTANDPNPQLADYGFLALDHHDLWGQVDKVRLTIVQPRVYDKPQTLTLTKAQLENFAFEVGDAISTIEAGDVSRHAGKWCKFCPVKGRCSTHREKARADAKLIFDKAGKLEAPRNYDPDELIDILEEAEMIALHIDGVRTHVMREMEKGRLKGQGWKIVVKRATAKWTTTDEELATAVFKAGGHRTDLYKDKLLTPGQLEKVLKTKKIELDLTDYFVKESSGYTLAREDDHRVEVKPDPFKDQ